MIQQDGQFDRGRRQTAALLPLPSVGPRWGKKWLLTCAAAGIISPWICLAGELLSPLKILLWRCLLAAPQVQARQSSQGAQPNRIIHPEADKPFFFFFFKLSSPPPVSSSPPPLLRSSADLESPVLMPKKMELTRENINALLASGSFKEKPSSAFSRGSTQTSGGRGQGKEEKPRERSICAAGRRRERHIRSLFVAAARHYRPFRAVQLLSVCFRGER